MKGNNMSLESKHDLDPAKLDDLWEQGYRGWEIYTYNEKPVVYCSCCWRAGGSACRNCGRMGD